MRWFLAVCLMLSPWLAAADVWVDLGAVDDVQGLENSHTSPLDGGDGENEAVECGPPGDVRDARRNWGMDDPTGDGPGGDTLYPDVHFYANVLDPLVKAQRRLLIEFTLYDAPDAVGTSLSLHYTNDKSTGPADIPNTFCAHPIAHTLEGSDAWIVVSWELADAGFRTFQQGSSDFRLNIGSFTRLCVDRIAVTVIVPEFPFDFTCEADEAFNVNLAWDAEDVYDRILIIRNGTTIATLPGDRLAYTDSDAPDGMHVYEVRGETGAHAGGESCVVAVYRTMAGVTVSVDLREEDIENGMRNSQTGPGDGENEPVFCGPPGDEREGRSNWGLEDPTQDHAGGIWPDTLLYFNVLDPAVKAWSVFKVRLTLYDDPFAAGIGVFMQYTNSRSQGPTDIENTFYPTSNPPTHFLAGTGEWTTLEWAIEDAGFRTFQQGTSDFRFGLTAPVRLCFDVCELEAIVPDWPMNVTCAQDSDGVVLTWEVAREYSEIAVWRDEVQIAVLPGDATAYTDADAPPGRRTYAVEGRYDGGSAQRECRVAVYGEVGSEQPFADPPGGWDYTYDPGPGDTAQTMGRYAAAHATAGNLDGDWVRSMGSDLWDGSSFTEVAGPPGPAPGGLDIVTLAAHGYAGEDIGVLSIEDAGNPAAWPQPNNAKIYLCYPLRDVVEDENFRSVLSDGATLAMRFRVNPLPYSTAIVPPNGYRNDFGGKGFVSLCHRFQAAGTLTGDQNLGISIDAHPENPSMGVLVLGVEPIAIPLEMATQFLTLWITIEDADGDPFTPEHHLRVWANGDATPIWDDPTWSFAGSGVEGIGELDTTGNPPANYLAVGIPSTTDSGALELDFLKFRDGVVEPGESVGEQFMRGDANADGSMNIADAITLLSYLFAGGEALTCPDAGDANDDGQLNIADAIAILGHLFGGTGPLPPPFGACGVDPTDDPLGPCVYPPCR